MVAQQVASYIEDNTAAHICQARIIYLLCISKQLLPITQVLYSDRSDVEKLIPELHDVTI
jgi:hypothetical protein